MASAAEGITIAHMTEPDQPLVFVNEAFLKMTGYKDYEVIGRNCRFLQGPETSPEMVKKIRTAIDNKKSVTVELLNYTKTKEPFWNRLTLAPIAAEAGGSLDYYVGVQFDVTEYKVMQKKIEHYANRMRAINDSADESLRSITATLNTSNGNALKAAQKSLAFATQHKNDEMIKLAEQLMQSIEQSHERISALRVVMDNCGGIDGMIHIDPITLTLRS